MFHSKGNPPVLLRLFQFLLWPWGPFRQPCLLCLLSMTWPLPPQDPITHPAFRYANSLAAIPTVISDLQRRTITEFFKDAEFPTQISQVKLVSLESNSRDYWIGHSRSFLNCQGKESLPFVSSRIWSPLSFLFFSFLRW